MGKLLENVQDGHPSFKPGELVSDAEMSTRAKRDVRIVRTFQVETIRVFELTCIAIGRAEHENDLLTTSCFDSAELEILQDHSASVLDWAFVTQQLVDRAPDEFGLLPKPVGLLRVTKQRIETVPD